MGGLSVGTIALYCSTCERDVYVAEEDTPVCPVCSAPLIAAVKPSEETEPSEPHER
jgi:hypothetical protein